MFRRFSPRDLRRLMKQLGMKVEELKGVKGVTIELEDRILVVENPQVIKMSIHDQTVLQITGIVREEVKAETSEEITISDEDVQLVASQAGVSLEEAKKALLETKGDLAQAIMLLESRKRAES
ncbi:MAG TPA: NagC family transcriptional regulator [Desulfurococcales archaeon]|nr:NagC family transcriptional regulator [Desulfurococcales archaeon]